MKVALFSPYATVAPHFETELEIAQRHLDDGDQVDYVACMGGLENCDFNRTGEASRCEDCLGRRRHGLSLLSTTLPSIPICRADGAEVPAFDTIADMKAHSIGSFDIGYAVLSSLVSFTRDPDPDLVEHRTLIEQLYRSAYHTYQFTLDYIQNSSPDRLYVFNGRFAAMRAVFRACQQQQIDCFLHERGCNVTHYELMENHLPHDIRGIHAAIEKAWEHADPDQRESIGANWFHDRINRVEKYWHSFVKSQEHGTLPSDWDPDRRNVAIFCSSDDEFVAIGDHWQNKLYANQLTAIEQLTESLQCDSEIHIYLRMHPNLTDAENRTKQAMLDLSYPNLTIIPPADSCDTYQLMHHCDVAVTFGSSAGIEAVFWDKPSILLGPCFYKNLPGPVQPASHQEAVDLIRNRNLTPADKGGAIKYGHWFQTRGVPHQYYEAEGLFHGKFKGEVVYAKKLKRTLPQVLKARASRFVRALTSNSTPGPSSK